MERRIYTEDRVFDGSEGYICWYCQKIQDAVYPIIFSEIKKFSLSPNHKIWQIEYHHPYIFILTKANDDKGNFYQINIETGYFYQEGNVKKFFVIDVANTRQICLLYYEGTNLKIKSRTFVDDDTWNVWFASDSLAPIILDVSVYDNRIFCLVQENRKVIYFSKQLLEAIPAYFLENISAPFFTFPEYFFVPPAFSKFLMYLNFLITETGIYELKKEIVQGILQYIPFKLVELTFDFSKINIQINQNSFLISYQNETLDVLNQKIISNQFVETYLSNSMNLQFKNEILGTLIFPADMNEKLIHFSKDEKLFVFSDVLVRQKNTSEIEVLRLTKQGDKYFDGKLIFLTYARDYFNTKYLKRIKIREAFDVWNIDFTKVQPVQVPSAPFNLIAETEDVQYEDGEWCQIRGVGKSFYIEIQPFSVMPILDIEYDLGR